MKKIFWKNSVSKLFVFAMLVGMMPLTAFAAETPETATEETAISEPTESVCDEYLANFDYIVDDSNQTITLTKYIGNDAAVVVADSYTVNGNHYKTFLQSETVFCDNSTITSVKIGSDVGFANNTMYKLFANCANLISVDMTGVDTSEVTSMRELFSLCTKMQSITGYENWDTGNVESIFKAFNQVFRSSKPSGVVIDLSKWDLSNVKNSGWCFQYCQAADIRLPDNLAVISSGFLNHAQKYVGETFTIPAGVQKIGYGHTIYDFGESNFKEFIVADGNTNYVADEGILYSKDGTELLAIPYQKSFENGIYEIPEGITFMGELSFSRNPNIQTLILPDSFVIECVEPYDDRYIIFEDIGNLNVGTNLTIAIYTFTPVKDYVVKDTNPNYKTVDGILYSKDMTQVVAIPTQYGRSIVIPEGVTTWNKQALWNDTEVSNIWGSTTVDNLLSTCGGISLPSTIKDIEADQFDLINRLKKKFGDSFTITVAENNAAYYVDSEGYLDVKSGPVITKQPTDVQVEIGEKFSISVQAQGDGLTYQWYYSHNGGKTFAASSFKSASYAMTMATYCHNRQIYCVVTDVNGNSVQTETVTITAPLSIIKQPTDVQVEIGEKFSVSVQGVGDGLTYQWYYSHDGGKSFAASCFTSKSYAMTMQSYCHNRKIYCVITDQYGNSVTSDTVTITRPPMELKILTQPADVYAPKGEKFRISVKAQGENLKYQWYYKESWMSDFKESSNTSSAYAYTMQNWHDGRQVFCVITDKFGNQVTTDAVTIHVEK